MKTASKTVTKPATAKKPRKTGPVRKAKAPAEKPQKGHSQEEGVAPAPTPPGTDLVAPGQSSEPLINRDEANQGTVTCTPAGIELATAMARNGASLEGIAAALGITRQTLASVRGRQPELDLAICAGLAGLETELVGTLTKAARNKYAPAAMFLLKTKFGYREKGSDDDAPKVAITLNLPEPKSRDEYMKTISGATDNG